MLLEDIAATGNAIQDPRASAVFEEAMQYAEGLLGDSEEVVMDTRLPFRVFL